MLPFIRALIAGACVFSQSRTDIAVKVLALRQQVAVLKRKRLFWTVLRATWSRWKDALMIVKPETVVGWHRAGFRLWWHWKSRSLGGRPRISEEVRSLIHRLARENADWAPKIHGELQKLGFAVSERTVARYLRRGDPGKRWLVFVRNHREAIVALDLFTVPTATFRVLYCLFIIEHGRRRILHFDITRHPSADWVVQQLRETFVEAGLRRNARVFQSPWQNGTAESWIGSCRRELLDHIIPVNEEHLRRLIREYVRHHQQDRVHDSLSKDTPNGRPSGSTRTAARRDTRLGYFSSSR